MQAPIDWLLAGEPYIEYRTRRDLLDEPEHDPAVAAARKAMLADPQVQRCWPSCRRLARAASSPATRAPASPFTS